MVRLGDFMTVNNFISSIWSAKLLASLKKDQVFTQAGVMNRDYTGEISGQGSVVKINGIGPVTIRPYVKNMPIVAPDTLSDAQTSLTIDQGNYFNFEVDDVDAAQQTPKIMTGAMEQASYDLTDTAEMYLADLLYDGVPAGNKIGTDSDAGAIVPNATAGTTAYDYLVPNFLRRNAPRPADGLSYPPGTPESLQKTSGSLTSVLPAALRP
jgi:hypothetical protein